MDACRIAQLAMMLSSDWPEKPLDALYIPGLTEGMLAAPDIFGFAVRLRDENWSPIIAFNGGDGAAFDNPTPASSWPGRGYYLAELAKRGVPDECLVPAIGPGIHTRQEIDGLVQTAKARSWKRIGIITIPYHYPRVFCFLPEPFKVHGWRPDVFALTPPSTDWYRPMVGSQGKSMTTPAEAALDDAQKVLAQIEKGWAAPLDDVFDYLRSRTR